MKSKNSIVFKLLPVLIILIILPSFFLAILLIPNKINTTIEFDFLKNDNSEIFSLLGEQGAEYNYDAYYLNMHIENNTTKSISFYKTTNRYECENYILPINSNMLSLELPKSSSTDTTMTILIKKGLTHDEIKECIDSITVDFDFELYAPTNSSNNFSLISDLRNSYLNHKEVKDVPVNVVG